MVGRDRMLRSALYAYDRWCTATSRAMLRALGYHVGVPVGTRRMAPRDARREADPDVAWCFANHGSPMDGRF